MKLGKIPLPGSEERKSSGKEFSSLLPTTGRDARAWKASPSPREGLIFPL